MSGFHILPPSWTSGATVTANSTDSPDVGATNTLFVQPSRKWRSATLGTLRLTYTASGEKPWDTVALKAHNGSTTGTVQIFATNIFANLFTSPSYTSAIVPLRFAGDLTPFTEYDTWIYTGALRSHQYIGIQIIDNINPDGYFQLGVTLIGVQFEPKSGPDIGMQIGRDDPSQMNRARNSEAVVRPLRGIDTGSLSFPKQSPEEMIRWYQINRVYGSKIPMIFKWDPIPSTQLTEQYFFYYGYPQWPSGGPFSLATGHGDWDVQMGVVEL